MTNENHKWTYVYITGKYIGEGWWLKISDLNELMLMHEIKDTSRVAKALKYGDHDTLGMAAIFTARREETSMTMGLSSIMSRALDNQINDIENGPLLFNENGGYNTLLTLNSDIEILATHISDSCYFRNLPDLTSDKKEAETELDITKYLDTALGIVAPNGDFIQAPFCGHKDCAEKIIKEKGWMKEFNDNNDCFYSDFLVFNKGYAIIDAPDARHINLQGISEKFTNAQKNTIYDKLYPFDKALANSIFKEEEIEKD